MPWSTVDFGKWRNQGKTLPQIVFADPDWFFWAVETKVFDNKGPLRAQAAELFAKATAIRIPGSESKDVAAEYIIHPPTAKFSHMHIVPADRARHEGASGTYRKDVIDLSFARKIAPYDKLGCSSLVSSAKCVLFGSKSARMTQTRCEQFFDDPKNFKR
jgi:hypothetical protein